MDERGRGLQRFVYRHNCRRKNHDAAVLLCMACVSVELLDRAAKNEHRLSEQSIKPLLQFLVGEALIVRGDLLAQSGRVLHPADFDYIEALSERRVDTTGVDKEVGKEDQLLPHFH